MTVRNVFLSLILSFALTFVVTVLYVFYPIISVIFGGFWSVYSSESHTDTIVAVAGGSRSLWIAVVIVLASFLIIFTLLQRRRRRR